MQGAREYATMFPSRQYGKLRIESGQHARGKTFHIFIGLRSNEVEVYGILGGNPGWTEYYGWKYNGQWQKDFEREIELRKAELTKEIEERRKIGYEFENHEEVRVQKVLQTYQDSP